MLQDAAGFAVIEDVDRSPEFTEADIGRRVYDACRRYTLAIPEAQVERLRSVLRKAANTFDQKRLYLSVAGIVEFVTPGDGDLDERIP